MNKGCYILLPVLIFLSSNFCWSQNWINVVENYLDSSKVMLSVPEYNKALHFAEEAKKLIEENDGNKREFFFNRVNFQLGQIWLKKGNYSKALEIHERTLKSREENEFRNNLEIGDSHNSLGLIQIRLGNYPTALNHLNTSLSIRLRQVEKDSTILIPSYVYLANLYIQVDSLDKANYYLKIAERLSLKKTKFNAENLATIYLNKGVVALKRMNIDESYNHFSKCIEFSDKKTEKNFELAKVYHNLGIIYHYRGNYSKAVELYTKYEATLNNLDIKNHPSLGSTLMNMGDAYKRLGKFEESLFTLKKSIKLFEQVYGENHLKTAQAYENVGILYKEKEQYDDAEFYYKKTLAIRLENYSDQHPEIGFTYNNLGDLYNTQGDYYRALDYFFSALSIFEKADYGEKMLDIAGISQNIGLAYSYMSEFLKAANYYNKSLEIREDILGKEHPLVALTLMNLGVLYHQQNKFEKARETYDKAYSIYKTVIGENSAELSQISNNIGMIATEQDKFNEALTYHNKAIEIELVRKDTFSFDLAEAYQGKAIANYNLRDSVSSIENFLKAEKIYASNFENGHPKFIEFYLNLATFYRKYSDFLMAKYYYKKAFSQLDLIREFYQSSASKEFQLSKYYHLFENALLNQFDLHSLNKNRKEIIEIFNLLEESKAYTLLDALQKTEAKFNAGIPETSLRIERQLSDSIKFYEFKIFEKILEGYAEQDSIVIDLYSAKLQINRRLNSLIEKMEYEYPAYRQFLNKNNITTLNKTQKKLLENNKSLLHFFEGDSLIYTFLVKKDTVKFLKTPKDFPLKELVQNLTKNGIYGYYNSPSTNRPPSLESQSIVNYTSAAQQLYDKLIAPVAKDLTEKVIIIPDGILNYIPFEALLTEEPGRVGKFQTYSYLVEKHQISYCYSATLLDEMQHKNYGQQPQKELLAMAPFYLEGADQLLEKIDTSAIDFKVTLRDSLGELEGSGAEVVAIKELFQGDSYLGEKATLETFKEMAANYRILHLSTHGKADDRVGDYAYLAFSTPDRNTFSKLYARDLYNLSLNADMVLLSACETGTGKLQRGEGIISLARAFAYAGAKSIFTTLWQVDDTTTKDIVIDFYKFLKLGKEKDEALRLAKLKYLENNKPKGSLNHPFFWAGMIGVGDMKPIR